MAHRRALTQSHGWVPWLLAAIALTLDGMTVLGFAGNRLPFGLAIPDAVLLVAPLLVYGGLAFVLLRTRPVFVRLAALATLLALHAGLVVLHALLFASVWSLPGPAALRLAHRWSPLIPLLQLVWVPLLALPLVGLVRPRSSAPSRRGGSPSVRRDVLTSRGTHVGHRGRPAPDREGAVGPAEHPGASVAAVQTTAAILPELVSSAPPPPASLGVASPVAPPVSPSLAPVLPVVREGGVSLARPIAAEPELPVVVARPVVLPDLDQRIVIGVIPAPPEPVVTGVGARPEPTGSVEAEAPPIDQEVRLEEELPPVSQPVISAAVAPIDAVLELADRAPEPERPRLVEAQPMLAAPTLPPVLPPAPPQAPAPPMPVVATAPPLDPHVVARLFEPYGPLLSRDGAILVDWTPDPEASVVCVAPRSVSRERTVRLAGRVARALGNGYPSASISVRRLSLRGPDGVAVLTPVNGGILVAAASRAGAAALLEVLSTRAVPGPLGADASPRSSGGASESQETRVSEAVRVETPAASLDVLTPSGVDAAPLAELAGRLLVALADDGADRTLHTLSVDLGSQRLLVHAVNPHVRPPRFVAVVGGPDLPGVLGRRAERAARTLREVS